VFQESGILRATNLRHNKKGEKCTAEDLSECNANPENYMLEDHVEFYIDLEQKTDGVWAPFIADDVQLQFTMLEPYYQVTMQREPGTDNVYSYKFRVPQRLGIYRFVVDYSRYGLTFLDEQS
jgi:oligosaccharyltransferase complex subunit beta